MAKHVQTGIFVVLVALVALRPLISETYDYRTDSISVALADIANPTPVRTLAFDLAILGCGFVWLITRATGPAAPFRRTGLEWGAVVVAGAAVGSCLMAGQQRVAITASLDWLCLPVLAITLTQLMRTRLHRRVLLAVILASACVQSFHCFEQYFVGFEETWSAYMAQKAHFWASQGVAMDSPKVELFERRMLAHEASGTFYHSNVAGSYLVLCGITALGLAISVRRRRDDHSSPLRLLGKIGAGLLAASILVTVLLTGSLGALLTGAAGIIALLLAWRFGPWIDRHRRKLFALGWAVCLLGCLAVVGHGLYHGSLPGSSLNFRWQYWVNSIGMIADHPVTGVGRENFGNHYLAYKSIESPEEVSNPHNLFVQVASEWGLLGLTGVLMMVWGLSRVLTKTTSHSPRSDDPAFVGVPSTKAFGPLGGAALLLMVGAIVVGGRLALCGSTEGAYLYYTGMITALVWVTGAIIFFHDVFPNSPEPLPVSCGTPPSSPLSKGGKRGVELPSATGFDPSPESYNLTATACSIGVLAFGVHELVNFAVFVPGVATTLFALIAVRCAEVPYAAKPGKISVRSRSRRLATSMIAAVALACVYFFAMRQPFRSARFIQQADAQTARPVRGSLQDQPAYHSYEKAALADPLDPYPCAKWVGWLRQASTVSEWRRKALAQAETVLAAGIERDPFNASLRRQQMHFYRERAAQTQSGRDLTKAIEAAVAALKLYPQHPRGIADLADCRRAAGQAENDRALLAQALEGYRQALALDDRRLKWEQLHRFSLSQTAMLQEKIRELEQALNRRK